MRTVTAPQSTHKQIQPATTELPTAAKPVPASAPQTHVPRGALIVSGVDTLEISLSLSIESSAILERFSHLKKAVQDTTDSSIPISFGQDEYFRWNLQRSGTKLYPFILRSGDISLLLSTRDDKSQIPNAKITIGSVSCHEDAFGLYRKVLMWLRCYGFVHVSNTITRVDLCVDTIGQYIDGLGMSSKYRWIRRGRKFFVIHDGMKFSSIQIGKGNIVLRCYDKILELQRDQIKREFFFDFWNFTDEQKKDPPPVTRVEFQLRRGALKDLETPVNTIEELEVNMDAIWQYCVTDWARLTSRSLTVDRLNNNQHLAPISRFWKNLQLAIFHRPLPPSTRRKKILHKNVTALKEQARGCLLNIAAAAGHASDDFFGIIETVRDVMSTEFADYMTDRKSDFVKLFKIRRNEVYVGF